MNVFTTNSTDSSCKCYWEYYCITCFYSTFKSKNIGSLCFFGRLMSNFLYVSKVQVPVSQPSLHSTQQHMLHSFFTTHVPILADNKVNKIKIGHELLMCREVIILLQPRNHTPVAFTIIYDIQQQLHLITNCIQGIHLIISRFEQFLCLGRFSIWICLATVINPPTLER